MIKYLSKGSAAMCGDMKEPFMTIYMLIRISELRYPATYRTAKCIWMTQDTQVIAQGKYLKSVLVHLAAGSTLVKTVYARLRHN